MTLTLADIPEDLMLTPADIRKAGFCGLGQRRWAEQNLIDYAEVLRTRTVSARVLFATGDANALRAIEFKLARMTDGIE